MVASRAKSDSWFFPTISDTLLNDSNKNNPRPDDEKFLFMFFCPKRLEEFSRKNNIYSL